MTAASQPRGRPAAGAVVLVVDPHPERARRVCGCFEGSGLAATTDGASRGEILFRLRALPEAPPSPMDLLEDLRGARGRGSADLCYAPDLSRWSIVERSRLILAGAGGIVDAKSPDFLARLHDAGLRLAASQRERSELAAAMAALGMVGASGPMLRVFETIRRAARLSEVPVLIMGESGTGKQLLAESLHRLDPKRSSGAFIPINCAAIAGGTAESTLFGHRRGAFTGADRDRKGLFRAASGGVLFLDEVGELPLPLQAVLLRALQERRVLAVGEDQEVPVDTRVVAATNRDLRRMVRDGTFREDLLHRLAVVSVSVPPLRDRPEDRAALLLHFLRKHRALAGDRVVEPSEAMLEALSLLELPGNARQLENLVREALVRKEGDGPLDLPDLPPEALREIAMRAPPPSTAAGVVAPAALRSFPEEVAELLEGGRGLAAALARCERVLLESALRKTRGNHSEAARVLAVTPRSVYNLVRRHGLGQRRR